MKEVVGVKFREVGKIYYFDPKGIRFSLGEYVVVETARGVESGEIVMVNRKVPEVDLTHPLKPIIRKATKTDKEIIKENREREKEAFRICEEKIARHNLKMKLISVEYTFDRKKILFYFTAEGRVDFRELVKDLAGVFRIRIELRQIGVRDEAKMLGGIGVCGRPFCCSMYLGGFQPVSIKMAKEQGLSLNPSKISGTCGRLMCCLKYEQDTYNELYKTTPKVGAIVSTPDGRGTVVEQNILTGVLKVVLDKSQSAVAGTYKVTDVKIIKDGKIRIDKKEMDALKALEDN